MTAATFSTAYFSGAGLMAGLIISLGPQNLLAIRAALRRLYAYQVAAFFLISDAALVLLGVGLASVSSSFMAEPPAILKFLFIVYLAWLGLNSLSSAFSKQELSALEEQQHCLRAVLLQAAAVTYLNPGVYLDAVGLVGMLSLEHPAAPWAVAAGAISTSAFWFFGIAALGKIFGGLFQTRWTWRVLEFMAGSVMILLAWFIYSSN